MEDTERHTTWRRRLEAIDAAGLRRELRCIDPTGPVTGRLNGKPIVIACSNDYLGLSHHPLLTGSPDGPGCGSSRLISGHRPIHRDLEAALTEWLGSPALVFPSGFQANMAVFSTVCEAGQGIASDALNHASIIDGLRLSRAEKIIVDHLDPSAIPSDVDLIAVEGLFSMDGDIPNLRDYPNTPLLAVDEAHALGCIGPDGRGVAADQSVQPDILIGTFGKALGAAGAFVSAHQDFIDLLVNSGRAFIYTTAPPEPVIRMALNGLSVLRREGEALRQQLTERTHQFRSGLREIGLEPLGQAHIVPVVFKDRTMAVAEQLLAKGVLATGIRYPTVPTGMERIRFTVSAAHTTEHIERILDALDQIIHKN